MDSTLDAHISACGVDRKIYFVMASVLYSIKIAINKYMCVLSPHLRLKYFCNSCTAFGGASCSQMWPVCFLLMLYRHQAISNHHVYSDSGTLVLISSRVSFYFRVSVIQVGCCDLTTSWGYQLTCFCHGACNTMPHYRLHYYIYNICDGELLWKSFYFLSMQKFIKMCTLFNFIHSPAPPKKNKK